MTDEELSWTIEAEGEAAEYTIFDVVRRGCLQPHSGKRATFSVIRSPDWVNVIAITPDQQVVLLRQYRHGQSRVTTEIPGGMVDAGEVALEAAKRELREETGFTSDAWISLGVVDVNPAIQTNRMSIFLAMNAQKTAAQDLDLNERIAVQTRPLSSVPTAIQEGEISHALVVAAFGLLHMRWNGWIPRP